MQSALAQKIIPLFPLKHVRIYTIERLDLFTEDWRRTPQRMNGLLNLLLESMDIEPVLNVLDISDEGVYREAT